MQSIQAWLNKHNNPANSTENSEHRLLLQHLLKQSAAWIYAHPEHLLDTAQIQQLADWLKDLQAGKPLAYITGEQMFWDLTLQVTPSTLIPRPDTEIIIETAVELMAAKPPRTILDLGTGSGALALVLASIYPDAMVAAVDVSAAALDVAKLNAKNNNIPNVMFQQSDWFDDIAPKQFELIVCNPPYIAAEDSHLDKLTHEPIKALVADQNGLGDYLRITSRAKEFLTEGGLIIFEHGWQQQCEVQNILRQAGFYDIGNKRDLAGHQRITYAFNTQPASAAD